jgi:site-specific DNA recombinase
VICGRCGKRFIGTAAHGKRQRYRYYTCNSRLRHGSTECTADRLPAEELDEALIEALLKTYGDTDLLDQALGDARARREADEPQRSQELAAIEVEMRRTEKSTERYFLAFESGSMPEAVCGPRIQLLGDKLADLRRSRTELLEVVEADRPVPTIADLRDLGEMVRDAFEHANNKQKKAWLKALVAEVRVDDRDAIYPVFKIPDRGVRHLSGLVGPVGLEPTTLRIKKAEALIN